MESVLKNNSTDQNQIESSDSIKQQISEITDYVKKNNRHVNFRVNVSERYKEFENKYPTLFRKIIESDCDSRQLDFMLHKLDQVRIGNQSQHDASVDVGQLLVDKYVKPELAKKNNQSKSDS